MSDYGERCVVRVPGSGNIDPVCRGRWEGLMLRRGIGEGVERRGSAVHCVHCDADVTARFIPAVWAQMGVPPATPRDPRADIAQLQAFAAARSGEEAAAVAKARDLAARALEVIAAESTDPAAVALARGVLALLRG